VVKSKGVGETIEIEKQMQLNLKNPIVFLDLETTGVDIARDRIVEISLVKIMPGGERDVKTRRVNPEMHIPEEASAIHGITDDDVKNEPTFRSMAKSMAAYMEGCDLAGFNSNRFDIPLLVEEFLRAGVDVDFKRRKFIDVQNIFHFKERRTLEAAYKLYCNKELEAAHSAEADVVATWEVLEAQLDRYPDLQNDVAFLSDFSARDNCVDYAGRIKYNEAGVEVFSFGKHKDKPVAQVFEREPSYYNWMMDGDFPAYTKKVITEIRLRNKK
jgi:DNA polymerase-3 subunit epsilon